MLGTILLVLLILMLLGALPYWGTASAGVISRAADWGSPCSSWSFCW